MRKFTMLSHNQATMDGAFRILLLPYIHFASVSQILDLPMATNFQGVFSSY